jgi:catechol 2,3-dioxygenase-like lactoylglutathione lyase family enzyme
MTPEPASSFGLGRIGQIALTITDRARAVAFYRDQLGMRLLFEAPPNLAFFDCDGIRLMLSPAEKPGEFSSIVYFRVEDIHKACEALAARGVEFERKPARIAQLATHDLWMAFFRDPDRNVLALMSEVPHKA